MSGLPDALRQALVAALTGAPPLALPAPWGGVRDAAAPLLRPWAPLVGDDPAQAVRAVDPLIAALEARLGPLRADPAHPDRGPLARRVAEALDAPPEGFAARAPALVDALCQEAPGGWGRFGGLRALAGALHGAAEARALQRALADRWALAAAEARARFEGPALVSALAALAPALERRRSEVLRLRRATGDLAWRRGWDLRAGGWREQDLAAVEQAAATLAEHPELRALVDGLGRAETPPGRAGPPHPTPREGGRSEVVGVAPGAELARVLASELALLGHPDTEDLFWVRLAERRLLGLEMRGAGWFDHPRPAPELGLAPPAPGRGPLVLCLDTSASMQGAPERLAKALTLAALTFALQQNRNCDLIAFSGPGELRARRLDGEDPGPLMELLRGGFSGGSDVGGALLHALGRAAPRADLLLVTDGLLRWRAEHAARLDQARAATGLRLVAALVGPQAAEGLPLADELWRLDPATGRLQPRAS